MPHTENNMDVDSDPFGFFASRGLAPPPVLAPAEVRRDARRKAGTILSNYHLLRAILERHEVKIQKRWEKKTRAQRLKILLQCWPDMPTTHRPDFAMFRKYGGQIKSIRPQDRSAFVWPYINQEDLTKTRPFPLLLNARGRNHPTHFAAADGDAMHLAKVTMAVVPVYLNEYVMILNGITMDEDYGKLLNWDDHPDAFDWMHQRRQFLPGEGLLILEVQDRLLAFLIACCRVILHDIAAGELVSDIHPIEPEPPRKSTVDSTGTASLAVMAEEAPYRVPSQLDLTRILSLLSARVARAEDHVWSLREDPSYFSNQLYEVREHRQEMIKDVQGSVHPTLKPPREGVLWARVVGSVITEAYLQVEIFSKLRDQASNLQVLQEKYATSISPEQDLPEEYLGALLKFRHYLKQTTKGPLNQLKMTVAASPPFRGFSVREVPSSVNSPHIRTMFSPGAKMDKTTEHLLWLLRTLWEDSHHLFLARLPLVVDELARLLEADPKARALVSPYVAMIIGELSILSECLRQVDTYFPWANGFEDKLVDREGDIKKEFAGSTKAAGRLLTAFHETTLIPIISLGDPSDKKFDYPLGRKRNEENVEKLREAEARLDAFWAKADDLMYSNLGDLSDMALKPLLTQPRPLYRTPEWTPPLKSKETGSQPDSTSDVDALLSSAGKTKHKTRGTPAPGTRPGPTQIASEETPDNSEPRFHVDARALKVFRILFYSSAVNTTPGEVAWPDFLHAMVCIGFGAQKLYGSVWHFQPLKLDLHRSI
ncbi:hypothetical protein F4778DRAFT_797768 [Xylariomycetidae sp. FL2044]|nr:hypothetical protein F4778DRAFT_797768 [Xylariomycetidae sp. FL2044]